ncbi:hypothetical protein DFH06DRAFT_1108470 [Mycena polygramma]|nr:hypothetical protein DFH06DRAFT_1108470 [Mycena polygramma]
MAETYTVQITFDSAKNLPVADIGTLSCDPYILAKIVIPDVEPLTFRTQTVHHTRDPAWHATWLVSGVPAAGFKLCMTLYDEDPGPKLSNDRLGKAVARFGAGEMKEEWESVETEYVLQKRKGDLHPYILTYLTALLPGEKLRKHNRVVASVRVLRKDDAPHLYTLGPNRYSRHFSPLIGSMVNKKEKNPKDNANDADSQKDGRGSKLSATTFIANKLQLTGPVPKELRHRFVGYRPFISWMFDDAGIAGRILNHGLRKQYRTIYKHDKSTVWGVVDDTGALQGTADATPEASEALAKQFLDMAEWGEGAKLFTYVITLDGEWRFTETGKEFAIDLLSKHSMHADLAKEIAYSGEFFVKPLEAEAQSSGTAEPQPNGDASSSTNANPAKTKSRDPKSYELIIDNDSGTYRPKKDLLPTLQAWLADARRLGGLGKVSAKDGFDEAHSEEKKERGREKARPKGANVAKMVPVKRGSSISSGMVGRDSVSSEEVDGALEEMEKAKEEAEKAQHSDTKETGDTKAAGTGAQAEHSDAGGKEKADEQKAA